MPASIIDKPGRLTRLLNRTIQPGETLVEQPLADALTRLPDGTYRVARGWLTVATVEPVIDSITGSWDTSQAQLQGAAWWTGQETADQSLIDKITGLQQTGVYFAYDSDTTTVQNPATYTSQTGTWSVEGPSLKATAWWGDVALATSIATELKIDKLSFGVSQSNSGSVYTVFWDAAAGQIQTVANLNPVISRTWAATYTAGSTITTVTVDALYWDGDSVEQQTFAADESGSFATSITDGYQQFTWDTCRRKLEGMTLTGPDGLQLTIT